MGISYSPKIVTDGLVLCLDPANARSYPGTGTTWTDLTRNNNLTLTNSPTFSSDNRGVFSFDGSDDYAVNTSPVGSIATAGQSFKTFSIFLNLNTASSFNSDSIVRLLGNSQYSLTLNSRNYENNKTISAGYYATDGGGIGASITHTHDDSLYNSWHMYTIRQYNNVIDLFIDEELVLTGTPRSGGPKPTEVDEIIIGNLSSSNTAYPLRATVSTALLYLKKLSNDEIRQNYLATKGRYE